MINLPKADFEQALRNKIIERIDRRGKYLLIRISGGLTIVSHLRMEGKYDVEPDGVPIGKHTHVIFFTSQMVVSFGITIAVSLAE